ncbi:MAG TPA: lytic transglycosylase domain-containing protein [Thermoleophilaceae bacterium]|nr:lytic transglycosylase domain-containing protein [Thermoleophilaceae bacterium]
MLVAAAVGAFAAASIAGVGPLGDELREVTLPLKHEDIIRQQAADKDLDPALIAAVIFEESRFRDQTSHAGARGLMQITPQTAAFIARDSGGTAFVQGDLATPQVNISYGAYYMRYLLRRYDGDVTLAVAAYNAGETNVNKWVDRAGGRDSFDAEDDVPFKETRDYVRDVKQKRQEYRDNYKDELGL